VERGRYNASIVSWFSVAVGMSGVRGVYRIPVVMRCAARVTSDIYTTISSFDGLLL